jgi:DNA ligase (NAD+)
MSKGVKLGGVTIKRATGYNAKYIMENGIGPGAIVRLIRSGDVIPKIIKVIKSANPQMPKEDYEWTQSGVDIILLDSSNNPEVDLKKATSFFRAIGVKDFSEGLVKKLFDSGIDTVPNICRATEKDLLEIPGIKEKTASKIVNGIMDSLNGVEMHVLMFASGCFGRTIGSKRLKVILSKYPDILKKKITKNSIPEIKGMVAAIPGFKMNTATTFVEGLVQFKKWYKTMPTVKTSLPKKVKKKGSRLEGEYVIFTGVRDTLLEKVIEENGGEVGSSFTKCTALITKDVNSDSGKANKARAKGIPIMTIETFKRKFGLE